MVNDMRTFEIHVYTGERTEVYGHGVKLESGQFVFEQGSDHRLFVDQDEMFTTIRNVTPMATDLYLVWDDMNRRKQLAARVTPVCYEIIKVFDNNDLDDDQVLSNVYKLVSALPQLIH